MKSNYDRHLPHQVPVGSPIFLTWNLKGALPPEVLAMLRDERERLIKQPSRVTESSRERKIREDKLIFAMADKYLDRDSKGPMHTG